MIGPRTHIILLTSFFTFAFSLLFLALVQNYVSANNASVSPLPVIAFEKISDVESLVNTSFAPTFGVQVPLTHFDFDSDDSLQKYLSTDTPFDDAFYIPQDLVPIDSHFTANPSQKFLLRKEAALQFADMARHFRNTFSGDKFYISSAYRSRGFQDFLIKQGCSLIKCAQLGTSEHQAGLALDLKIMSKGGRFYSLDTAYPNKYSDWLKTNAASFGFHNTYQKGVEVDGKIVEGWHRRYLGTELATLLADKDQTFAEYYNGMGEQGRGTCNEEQGMCN